jgi:hypothetical protein
MTFSLFLSEVSEKAPDHKLSEEQLRLYYIEWEKDNQDGIARLISYIEFRDSFAYDINEPFPDEEFINQHFPMETKVSETEIFWRVDLNNLNITPLREKYGKDLVNVLLDRHFHHQLNLFKFCSLTRQMHSVIELNSASNALMSSLVRTYVKKLMKNSAYNFPNTMKKVVINKPFFGFSAFWYMVKPWLSKEILEKTEINY